jgi:hypothetical protein
MSEPRPNEAIARIAPAVLEAFQGRGLIDFRVFPNKPTTLFVYVHLLCAEREGGHLDVLCAVAATSGLEVERSCRYGETVWIEVSTQPAPAKPVQQGAVVPFTRRAVARAALAH